MCISCHVMRRLRNTHELSLTEVLTPTLSQPTHRSIASEHCQHPYRYWLNNTWQGFQLLYNNPLSEQHITNTIHARATDTSRGTIEM